jgi:hypothetical protein
MTEGNWSWLEHPDLERKIASLDSLPPDLDRLTQCVRWIVEALNMEIKIEFSHDSAGPAVRFQIPKAAGSRVVAMKDGIYSVHHRYTGDLYTGNESNTAYLAWIIAGFPSTPKVLRAAIARAKEQGISTASIPLSWAIAKPESLEKQSERSDSNA